MIAQSLSPQTVAPPEPENTPTSSAPAAITPLIAYDTADLPEDRAQAWEMLRSATTLNDGTLQPWTYRAHYKTYDAYGKPKGNGTVEYVWVAKDKWRETYFEGSTAWSQWKTSKGWNVPLGQPAQLDYSASLIMGEILHPLGSSQHSAAIPPLFGNETFGPLTLACFSNTAQIQPDYHEGPYLDTTPYRICVVPGKPYLRLTQGIFTTFYDKLSRFQHRVIAGQILMKEGNENAVEITMDSLRAASQGEIASVEPPVESVSLPGSSGEHSISHAHLVRKVLPQYPLSMKYQRVSGAVRLEAMIQKDGSVKALEVVHSPAPELTAAAENAVQQWMYTPALQDGKPIEMQAVITINFILDHR